MNYTLILLSTIAFLAFLYYFVKSYKKLSQHQMPFFKAFNPFYTLQDYEIYKTKKSIQPIITEMNTKSISSFMKIWTNKFAQNTLSLDDVKFLNEQVVDGDTSKIDGILALHPNAKTMYDALNETLKPIDELVKEEELIEA